MGADCFQQEEHAADRSEHLDQLFDVQDTRETRSTWTAERQTQEERTVELATSVHNLKNMGAQRSTSRKETARDRESDVL